MVDDYALWVHYRWTWMFSIKMLDIQKHLGWSVVIVSYDTVSTYDIKMHWCYGLFFFH